MKDETKKRIIEQVEKTPMNLLSINELNQYFELKYGRKQKHRTK